MSGFTDWLSNLFTVLGEEGGNVFRAVRQDKELERDEESRRQYDDQRKLSFKREGYDYRPLTKKQRKESKESGIEPSPFRVGDFLKTGMSEDENRELAETRTKFDTENRQRQAFKNLLRGTKFAGQEEDLWSLEGASPGGVSAVLRSVLAPTPEKPRVSPAGLRTLLSGKGANTLSDPDLEALQELPGVLSGVVGEAQGTRRNYLEMPPNTKNNEDTPEERAKALAFAAKQEIDVFNSNPNNFINIGLGKTIRPELQSRYDEVLKEYTDANAAYRAVLARKPTPGAGGDANSQKAAERRRVLDIVTRYGREHPNAQGAKATFRSRWGEEP